MRNAMLKAVLVFALAWGGQSRAEDLFPILKDGKWGYMNNVGKVVIAPKYDCAFDFSEGLACVQVGLLRGYIDEQGAMAIPPKYFMARPFSDGLAAVYINAGPFGDFMIFNRGSGQWVYIDKTGKTVITPKGECDITASADEFREGHARVCYLLPWLRGAITQGFLSKDGRINGRKSSLGRYSEGLAACQVTAGGKWCYIDADGKEVLPPLYATAGDFSQGLAPVAVMVDANEPARTKVWTRAAKYCLATQNPMDNKTWGTNRVFLADADAVGFGDAQTFTFEVTAPMKVGKCNFQWQLLGDREWFGDMTSNVVVNVVTAQIAAAAAPAAKATEAGTPKEAPPAPPKGAPPLVNGARFVSQTVPTTMTTGQTYGVSITMKNTGPTVKKWCYIDKRGEKVIAPQFDAARAFSDGLAAVCIGDKWGCIDKTGKVVIKPQYDFVGPLTEGLARIVVAGKHGYIDATGKTVVEPKFDVGWAFSKGLARIIENHKLGYIGKTGKYVWEPKESPFSPLTPPADSIK